MSSGDVSTMLLCLNGEEGKDCGLAAEDAAGKKK
jgi:hypothetical protein